MQSICTFKSTILGDPRILMMGATAKEESQGKRNESSDSIADENDAYVNPYIRMDNETRDSYNSIANMMEQPNMNAIMSIFAEKILMNLVYTSQDEEDDQRIVDTTLEVMSFYCGTTSSCRLIGSTEIMQKLISDGSNNFQIL